MGQFNALLHFQMIMLSFFFNHGIFSINIIMTVYIFTEHIQFSK